MSQKKLHIHSTPLLLLAIAVTVVSATSAIGAGLQSPTIAASILHPAVRLESSHHGYVKITVNNPAVEEAPGAVVDVPQLTDNKVAQAVRAADLIGLQLAINAAVR
jgi:hypothetical protein